jgi:hypothetical protein
VDATTAEGVEDDCQGGGERLALAGAHLRDRPVVEGGAADELDVEVAHSQRALARLAGDRERLVEQVVERLAVVGALAEVVGALVELGVGLQLELGFEVVDPGDDLLVGLVSLGLAYAQGAIENGHVASVATAVRPSGAQRAGFAGGPSGARGEG